MEVTDMAEQAPCGAKLGEAMALADFVEPKIWLLPTWGDGVVTDLCRLFRVGVKPPKSFLLRAKRNSSMPG
jgi:hypothetical protein